MGFPLRTIALVAATGSVALHNVPQLRAPTPYYVSTGLLLFAVQTFAWVVWAVILFPRFFSPLRHLPQPKNNSFFMGQFPRIAAEPNGSPMKEYMKIPNDGLVTYRSIFNVDRVMVTTPKGLSEVLVQKSYDFIKPPSFIGALSRLLGVGVLLAEGDEHRMQRKKLMPAFAFRHIKDLYPVFWSKTREVTEAITETIRRESSYTDEKGAPSAVVEISGWTSRVTLDIIGIAGMGRDIGAVSNPQTELNQAYRSVTSPTGQAEMLQLLGAFLPLWIVRNIPVKRNNDMSAAVRIIRKNCHELIEEKKRKLAEKQESDVDILSVAIRSGGFSDTNLVDQMMTFLAAGHETTSSALTWASYLLCLHPDTQRRLRAEIRENLQSPADERPMSAAELDKLPYLHAVCNETLRFYPSVPLTIREAASPNATIQGHAIPQGTKVMIPVWAFNTATDFWGPDAAAFNPDRWMGPGRANTGGASSNYAFMTFLHGPRSCIGQGFAKAEFACLLAALVGRFEMELADPAFKLKVKGGITSKPSGGLKMKMTVLEGW
ncbi:MAG: hypothetical protein M1832_005424 [Thelocarpon impressellum]|nr:MAG: hypothetical protein M1832_005424 [Thelocarpon impressellum]